jgi:cation diffusion facilitator CzcD-associated flavoprotein CzcO
MSRNGHRAGQRRNAGERPHVAIIGAGVSGICLAILLKKAGLDFTLFEKADEIGGTWRDNFYPGSGCDIVSHLYSYSFELKPDWSCKFAKQDEILDYLDHCVRKYDLSSHLVLGTEIAEARFDEVEGLWHIHTADGAEAIVDVLVSSTGQLNRPAFPAIEGLDSFGGTSFHSARWNHEYDLEGKTVAVVGSGASAIRAGDRAEGEAADPVPALGELDRRQARPTLQRKGEGELPSLALAHASAAPMGLLRDRALVSGIPQGQLVRQAGL